MAPRDPACYSKIGRSRVPFGKERKMMKPNRENLKSLAETLYRHPGSIETLLINVEIQDAFKVVQEKFLTREERNGK